MTYKEMKKEEDNLLKQYDVISRYFFAETDERLKKLFRIDLHEKIIEILYINKLMQKIEKSK